MEHTVELGSVMSRYAELAHAAYGNEPVPTCPGWEMDDLTFHLGSVHRWAASILLSGQRLDQPRGVYMTEPADEWYAATAAALLEVIRAVPADEPTPNFSRIGETAAFWARRQMHETTIHVVDACLALGLGVAGWPVSAELAADGVDEVLSVFFARLTALGRRPDLSGRVRLTATDTGRVWVIAEAQDTLRTPVQMFPGEVTEVDGEISASATELYLALWGRISVDQLHASGSAARSLLNGPLTP